MTNVEQQHLLLPEVAAVARVSVSTVRQWIATGRLRSSRPGRRRIVRRDELERFLARDITVEASRDRS